MLGLSGETRQLLSEYKKHQCDGEAHRPLKECVSRKLGNPVWYISIVASKFDLSLSAPTAANLVKVDGNYVGELVSLHDTAMGFYLAVTQAIRNILRSALREPPEREEI